MKTKITLKERNITFTYDISLSNDDINICENAKDIIDNARINLVFVTGKALLDVKKVLPHGQFGKWLKHYFGWSERNAYRMMQCCSLLGISANLANLPIDQSALYLLSEDSCPEELTEEIIKEAENGKRITHAYVKKRIADETKIEEEEEEPLTKKGETLNVEFDVTEDEEPKPKTKKGKKIDQQKYVATLASTEVINYLGLSDLVRNLRDNPYREEAFREVLTWLTEALKGNA